MDGRDSRVWVPGGNKKSSSGGSARLLSRHGPTRRRTRRLRRSPSTRWKGIVPGSWRGWPPPSAIGRRDQLSRPTEVSLAYVLVTVLGW